MNGTVSIAVSPETRKILNRIKLEDEYRSVDELVRDLLKLKGVS